jgi:hypothetical protein
MAHLLEHDRTGYRKTVRSGEAGGAGGLTLCVCGSRSFMRGSLFDDEMRASAVSIFFGDRPGQPT